MTKPHDETWEHKQGRILGPDESFGDGRTVAIFYGKTATAEPRAVLAAAAPKLARTILEHAGSFGGENDAVWHTFDCWQSGKAICTPRCRTTRDALKEVGVLP